MPVAWAGRSQLLGMRLGTLKDVLAEISWWSALLLLLQPEMAGLIRTGGSASLISKDCAESRKVGGTSSPSCHLDPSLSCVLAGGH